MLIHVHVDPETHVCVLCGVMCMIDIHALLAPLIHGANVHQLFSSSELTICVQRELVCLNTRTSTTNADASPGATCKCNWPGILHSPSMHSIQLVYFDSRISRGKCSTEILTERHSVVVHIDYLNLDFSRQFKFLLTFRLQ